MQSFPILLELGRVITEVVHAFCSIFSFKSWNEPTTEYVPEKDHSLIRNTLKCHSINYQYSTHHCFSSTYKTIIKQMLGI